MTMLGDWAGVEATIGADDPAVPCGSGRSLVETSSLIAAQSSREAAKRTPPDGEFARRPRPSGRIARELASAFLRSWARTKMSAETTRPKLATLSLTAVEWQRRYEMYRRATI